MMGSFRNALSTLHAHTWPTLGTIRLCHWSPENVIRPQTLQKGRIPRVGFPGPGLPTPQPGGSYPDHLRWAGSPHHHPQCLVQPENLHSNRFLGQLLFLALDLSVRVRATAGQARTLQSAAQLTAPSRAPQQPPGQDCTPTPAFCQVLHGAQHAPVGMAGFHILKGLGGRGS